MWLVPVARMAELDRWAKNRKLKRDVIFVVSAAGPLVPASAYFDAEAPDGKPNSRELKRTLKEAVRSHFPKEYLAQQVKGTEM
jgi:hypothetical protein